MSTKMRGEDQEPAVAVIGGTGVGQFPLDEGSEEPRALSITTPYGETAARVGRVGGRRVVFLARHGAGHRLPPHRIPYRANLCALAALGVRGVFATTAVGGLRPDLAPGDFVLLDNFIDFTRDPGRGMTFFDAPGQVVHCDFSVPYSPELRSALLEAARTCEIVLRPTGTYLCGDGPRYETPAEVRLFAQWGADVVGMTGVPEATLAREAGLHYAGVSLVTNPGAGLSPHPLTHEEVERAMAHAAPRLRSLLLAALSRVDPAALPPVGPGATPPGFSDVRVG